MLAESLLARWLVLVMNALLAGIVRTDSRDARPPNIAVGRKCGNAVFSCPACPLFPLPYQSRPCMRRYDVPRDMKTARDEAPRAAWSEQLSPERSAT